MDGFSGVVRLSNVSDFIAPAQNCVIPLNKNTRKEDVPLVGLKLKNEKDIPKKSIKVTLNDCLACNGCITSAETVLVEEQSMERLLDGIQNCSMAVVSVSPQSVCSIAARRKLTISDTAKLIGSFFLQKGVRYVIDTSFARQFSLDEGWIEFIRHIQQSSDGVTRTPILSSECPGFVCYAEKTHGELLVPLISKTRSGQAIMGAIVKDFISKSLSIKPTDIYHATVMPCFDKKLEASRSDFEISLEDVKVREVDCVVSTAELDAHLDSVTSFVDCQDPGFLGDFARGRLISSQGGTSGGFAESIVTHTIKEYSGTDVNISKPMKNVEVVSISVEGRSLRIARVFGFRNIQNLVRKLKTKKCDYDYVEIMACPSVFSGCANGGGQIREETTEKRDELLNKVEHLYETMDECSADIEEVTQKWAELNPDYRNLLMTNYRTVTTNIGSTLSW